MLKRRLTDRFKMVCGLDPALEDIDDETLRSYLLSRDFDRLDLTKCENPPTVFHCKPLQSKYEHLVDAVISNESGAAWSLFRTHVTKADNFTNDVGHPIITLTDGVDPKVEDKCRDLVPRDVVTEVAQVIIQKANEVSKGFIIPDTLWQMRARSRALRALTAPIVIANDPSLKSTSNQVAQSEQDT